MRTALSWILLGALLTHVVAHLVIAAKLAHRREWRHAAFGLLLPPLAPLWGWRAGMRAPVYAWAGALLVYALGVAAA